MRTKFTIIAMACALICLAPVVALAAGKGKGKGKSKGGKTVYYLALGDSLSVGSQPNAAGTTVTTKQGYADLLYKAEKKKIKNLKLVDLGCLSHPGESTTTMINGGKCHYAAGSQLKQAVKFLKKHKGHVKLVTIDIGANDIDPCVQPNGQVNLPCIGQGIQAINTNLPKIGAALRKAGGKKVPMIGMTYYDPFLASWFQGSQGQSQAAQSQQLSKQVNSDITSDYQGQQFKVADVATAFHTYDNLQTQTTTYQGHNVPVAVAKICQLTWMCAPAPKGPNIHGNPAGYKLMEKTFKPQI